MRTKFEEQLVRLNNELITMGAMCEEAIASAAKALSENNQELCEKAYALEREIDQKETDISDLCMKLLLRQQPVARDLRTVSSALKMISDMERIGDQAADIADIAKIVGAGVVRDRVPIRAMAEAACRMVADSVDSFVKKDLVLAREVMAEDDGVDALFDEVKTALITLIAENPSDGEEFLDMLMIAKYLERIGDHAVNIAEWVEYSITGTNAKHRSGEIDI